MCVGIKSLKWSLGRDLKLHYSWHTVVSHVMFKDCCSQWTEMTSFNLLLNNLLSPNCKHWHPQKTQLYPLDADVQPTLVLSRWLLIVT